MAVLVCITSIWICYNIVVQAGIQIIQASFHASNRDCSGCSVSFESNRATVTCVQVKLELCHPDLLVTKIE